MNQYIFPVFNLIPLLFFLTASDITAQEEYYFNDGTEKIDCPYDSSVQILTYKNFDVYQTENDLLDGPWLDQCINLIKEGFKAYIPLTEINVDKPVFFKLKNNFLPINLEANSIYSIEYVLNAVLPVYKNNINCNVSDCTKLFVTKSTLNENGDGYYTEQDVHVADIFNNEYVYKDFCSPTANIIGQEINDFTFEVYLSDTLEGNKFNFNKLYIRQVNTNYILNDIFISDPVIINDEIELTVNDLTTVFSSNHLVVHTKGYPSANNKDVKRILLVDNPSVQKNINLRMDFFNNLFFQEFTSLGAGLVEGSDSIYHKLNLFLDGGDFCLESVDLVINNGGSFRYKKGSLNLNGMNACINFKNQSTFFIEQESTLRYGLNGEGILGLTNGRVEVEEAAELVLDGRILLDGRNGGHSNVYLKPGAKLKLTSNVTFIIKGEEEEKLYVHGYKYQVDFSEMDPAEADRIVIIEPTNDHFNLEFYPNPSQNAIFLQGDYDNSPYQLYNQLYQEVQSGLISNNEIGLLPNLLNGIYFLVVNDQTAKVIVNRE